MMTDPDWAHLGRVTKWLSLATIDKYQAGVQEHGGHLPNKGGLLREAESEVIDQAVYLHTLREQLLRVEKWMEHGETNKARIALRFILRGTATDLFPED
jgi:hypothetical protein